MKFVKKYFLLLLCVFSLNGVNAQGEEDYTEIKRQYALSFGIVAHTNGLGITSRLTKFGNIKSNTIYDLDIVSLKHPKEIKIVNQRYDDARPYVYGKMNSALNIKPAYGKQFILAEKREEIGVRVYANISIGPMLTALTPAFLEIIQFDSERNEITGSKIEKYDPDVHSEQYLIRGGAPFLYGIRDLNFTYGLHNKTSLLFDWSGRDDKINIMESLEVGIITDFYPDQLPILANYNNERFFTNLFVNITFGNRW